VIPVAQKPKPANFREQVAIPGAKAIADYKAGAIAELPALWRKCLDDLRVAYRNVCAYSGLHIPEVTGADSVEHFAPKSDAVDRAYDWSNYRLVCRLLNSRKREFQDVLDPFLVGYGWFVLNLVTMTIAPAKHLPDALREQVQDTIDRLKLDDAECCRGRMDYYELYRTKDLSFQGLQKLSPFVAFEVERQGLKRAE